MKISKVNVIRKLEENLPMKKELLSIPEAAELLSCSTRTVRRLIAERTLEACKLRSSTRVVYASLRGYILTIIGDYQEKNGMAEFKSSG
jgi:excisionase family DNA binding protein